MPSLTVKCSQGCGKKVTVFYPHEICAICKGHGDIWVNWHPTPVTCGHCHGTGGHVTCSDCFERITVP